jgi:hypothetical protein
MALFNDGFESGNFAAWSTTIGSPTVVASPAHDGTKAMKCTATNQYVRKTLASAYSDIYCMFYVYFAATPNFCFMAWITDETNINYVKAGATDNKWFIQYQGNNYIYSAITVIPTGIWVCVEFRRKVGAGNGVATLWVNGVSMVSASTLNLTGNDDRVYLGETYEGAARTVYFDCINVSETPIGMETVPTPTMLPVGATYPATQNIVMSDTRIGASIYYTDDGSAPDDTKTLYGAPVNVVLSKTLKAIAIETAMLNSAVATEIYVINLPPTAGEIPQGPPYAVRRRKELLGLTRDYLVMKGAR